MGGACGAAWLRSLWRWCSLRLLDSRGGCPHMGDMGRRASEVGVGILRLRMMTERLLGEEVVEGFYGGEFVVFDVEDGVELGDLEDVADFFGEAEEFQFATGVADGGEAAD